MQRAGHPARCRYLPFYNRTILALVMAPFVSNRIMPTPAGILTGSSIGNKETKLIQATGQVSLSNRLLDIELTIQPGQQANYHTLQDLPFRLDFAVSGLVTLGVTPPSRVSARLRTMTEPYRQSTTLTMVTACSRATP